MEQPDEENVLDPDKLEEKGEDGGDDGRFLLQVFVFPLTSLSLFSSAGNS